MRGPTVARSTADWETCGDRLEGRKLPERGDQKPTQITTCPLCSPTTARNRSHMDGGAGQPKASSIAAKRAEPK
ncbi:hypothetical protein Adu01nite_02500 [Paractinoplanes durhamensis]|uniref:Uncharacterized protein n=1 Tax=Paractinoplanes durhamensis TaxID=113563 RepID=A0ABQ3YMX2_9ACTN|nr:hypothetical protein Adu01nite_02500 [Actinoplanes durhamensis]